MRFSYENIKKSHSFNIAKSATLHDWIAFIEIMGIFIMKEIKLTQGKAALVDDEDFEYLNQFNWCAIKDKNTYYAKRSMKVNGKKTNIRMHSIILGTGEGDHIDNNGLNNQRHNLRKCTHQQNCINRRSRKNSTSNHKGVSWDSEHGKWLAQIQINGKKIFLGRYTNELDATLAYDEISIEHFKEFANLNLEK